MIKKYFQIIKPGIIFGNLISVIAGFLLASRGKINYFLLVKSLIGVSLVIASSCIFNNVIDRDLDKKMLRTQNRILTKKIVPVKLILSYASILGLTGFIFLYFKVQPLSMWLSLFGFIIYVCIYTLYMKRHSIYSTIVGSLSGSMPPLIGYCSVTNQLDSATFILMLIFSLWQIPHSYAIGISHLKDYKTANIPILPTIKSVEKTKKHILFYIFAFIMATALLTFSGYTGYKYLLITESINLYWLYIGLSEYKTQNNENSAHKLFVFSIITILILNLMISIDYI